MEKNRLIISKELFVKAVNDAKEVNDYGDGLNRFFRSNGCDGYLLQPDCIGTVIDLLHYMFAEKDDGEWISYFCFDLNFGRDYELGCVTDYDGSEIKLETVEDLYDFLTKK